MEPLETSADVSSTLPAMDEDTTISCAMASIQRWLDVINPKSRRRRTAWTSARQKPSAISMERQMASLADTPLRFDQMEMMTSKNENVLEETVLYLGYGSNMSAETFRGKRGIEPLSQINALVPQLALTFNLPGVPYSEPCFANTRYRDTAASSEKDLQPPPYHKDRWSKGLVGIVYEITKADYAHVLATEGGGAAYQDVLVDCYALKADPQEKVPMEPQGVAFKAHTLFCPPNVSRPDPSYAQPSARYLKLLTDGAAEHELPHEYQEYLEGIRTYTTTSAKQQLGAFIFLTIWMPIFAFIFGGAGMFLNKDGKYPKWFARFAMATFEACWASYDDFFKKTFGDGERTVKKHERDRSGLKEKEGLIQYHRREYGSVAS